MLSRTKQLKNYKLNTIDGEIGKVKDLYFDDQEWTIRYLVVDTGRWLSTRKVLISTHAMEAINKEEEYININLTNSEIENSPSLERDKPVSRQYQTNLNTHYNFPMYWTGLKSSGMGMQKSGSLVSLPIVEEDNYYLEEEEEEEEWDPDLRSTEYVRGYHIETSDNSVWHISDFIVDDETWQIRYLVIDTPNWLPSKKILVSTQWIEKVNWDKSLVVVNITREQIKQAIAYDEEEPIDRNYEISLYKYFDKKAYWETEISKGDKIC